MPAGRPTKRSQAMKAYWAERKKEERESDTMRNNDSNILIGLFWFALAVVVALAVAMVLGDEHGYGSYGLSGAAVGLIAGFIIAIVFIQVPISLGSGIILHVPQGWNGNQYVSQCTASTQTVSYPNGATSQVQGAISCTIEVSNQTQATKTFQIANVPEGSTITVHSFTNYTISGGSQQKEGPSYYTGTIEAIYTDHPSYIQYTTGQQYYGNLTEIKNLSVNGICKVQIGGQGETPQGYAMTEFVNGSCT